MQWMMRVVNGAVTVLLVLLIAAATVLGLSARRSPDAIPTVMGRKVLTVISGSMAPSIKTGDVIVVRPLAQPAQAVKDGDVITYRSREKADMLITHRVVGTVLINGQPAAFVTKGDANEAEDSTPVGPDQIVGRYEWRVPYFGYLVHFLRRPVGIVLGVIVPGLVLIALELRKIWQALSAAEASSREAAAPVNDEDAHV